MDAPSTSRLGVAPSDELDSEYAFGSNTESTADDASVSGEQRKRKQYDELYYKQKPNKAAKPEKSMVDDERRRHQARQGMLTRMDAHSRHKHLINQYLLYYPGATQALRRDTSRDRTDKDIIRANHKFVWDSESAADSWEKQLAKKYYDRLFKEYCITDLCRYKENKIALRWRVEKEVVEGKGQFICGNKKCPKNKDLESWEVNFGYVEDGVKKNALVKLRLCPECSDKLNYHHKRSKAKKKKRRSKHIEEIVLDKEDKPTVAGNDDAKSDDNSDQIQSQVPNPKVPPEDTAAAWKKPIDVDEDKSREEEFEEFLDDLLL